MPDEAQLAREAIDAMHDAFGEHDGRVVHVKGGWAEATFTATPEGGALCRAPFLRGTPVPALVRFSNGGGNPVVHDGDRGGRGIGVKLQLDDGARTDLLGISVPVFTSRTAEDFVAYVRLARRDPETGEPDFAAIGAFLEAHPETATALGAAGAIPPPASWLTTAYNGIHTFKWIAPDGTDHWVRTRWMPDDGVETLTDEDAQARDRDYLAADLRDRVARGQGSFTLLARLAQPEDALDDPTAPWPEAREAVAVGRLAIERAIDAPETLSDIRVFDPMRLCNGIDPSADPILHFRPKVYDVSARGRWSGE
ncbi:MAG: catalase [Actinomycetota bacterium]|nr:catalase [Actinomycetota bacterium]